jgi:hypothetical protein
MAGHIASAGSVEWNTPKAIVDAVVEAFGTIDLDPCSNGTSIVHAKEEYLLPDDDGLVLPWRGHTYVNPPFGGYWQHKTSGVCKTQKELEAECGPAVDHEKDPVKRRILLRIDLAKILPAYSKHSIADWVDKAAAARQAQVAEVIMLSPATVDTKSWQRVIFQTADALCFVRGRVRFLGAPASAPMPVALIYWGLDPRRFVQAMKPIGHGIRQ